LPNYVAAALLVRQRGTVYLIFTDEVAAICGELQDAIQKRLPEVTIKTCNVDNADSGEIQASLLKVVAPMQANIKGEDVGLHYTGGTKVMSIHAYQILAAAFPALVCTYLDAKELRLIRDEPSKVASAVYVRDKCSVSLQEIAALHGYALPGPQQIQIQAHAPQLLVTICDLYHDPSTRLQWKEWTSQAGWTESNPSHGLDLLRHEPKFQSLQPLLTALNNLCGGVATPAAVARALGVNRINSCKTWFNGTWLEEYTLDAINQHISEFALSSYGLMNKQISKRTATRNKLRNFQLDVAFSCMASEKKASCKEHLLEVYVRARQLGGDEARVALVCGYEKTGELQDEVEDEWFTEGRIRVFGMAELADLQNHIRRWLAEANQPKTRR
jgi:hypothetical protein